MNARKAMGGAGLLLLLLLAMQPIAVRAEDAPATAMPATTEIAEDGTHAQPVETPEAPVDFSLERDPFWPVGFDPALPTEAPPPPPPPMPDVIWPTLRLLGFIEGDRGRLAMIEGVGPVRRGDVATRIVGNRVFEWEILELGESTVEHRQLRVRTVTPADRIRRR